MSRIGALPPGRAVHFLSLETCTYSPNDQKQSLPIGAEFMPKGRKKGTRFSDISARAGVGIATVDRVLNDRGNVSAETALKVIEAARELGVNRLLPLPYRSHVRYKLICARHPKRGFVGRLNQAFQESAAAYSSAITLERSFVDEYDSQALVDEIDQCAGRYRGLIILPRDDEAVRDAVNRVCESMPVVTIVSDIKGSMRQAFVGVDNYRAGRTAALLGSTKSSKSARIGIVWLGHGYLGQLNRVQGFKAYYDANNLSAEISTHEAHLLDPDAVYTFIRKFLRQNPKLNVLYNAGLHDAAIAKALVAERRDKDICFIGHELTEGNVALMKEGVIDFLIDQDPKQQAQRALELLLYQDGIIEKETRDGTTEFRIYCRENLQTA